MWFLQIIENSSVLSLSAFFNFGLIWTRSQNFSLFKDFVGIVLICPNFLTFILPAFRIYDFFAYFINNIRIDLNTSTLHSSILFIWAKPVSMLCWPNTSPFLFSLFSEKDYDLLSGFSLKLINFIILLLDFLLLASSFFVLALQHVICFLQFS